MIRVGGTGVVRWATASVALLGGLWLGYSVAILPLQRREQQSLGKLADLRERIQATRKTIQEVKQQEQATASSRAELDRLERELPTGSALAWFPVRMKQHFDRFGLSDSVTRLNTSLDEPNMPGYQRTYWAVDLPMQGSAKDFSSLLIAVAELEESDPIIEVLDLSIRRENASLAPTAIVNVAALVRD
jgi:Tfp pilus assembly protein PilO